MILLKFLQLVGTLGLVIYGATALLIAFLAVGPLFLGARLGRRYGSEVEILGAILGGTAGLALALAVFTG